MKLDFSIEKQVNFKYKGWRPTSSTVTITEYIHTIKVYYYKAHSKCQCKT